MSLSFMSPSHCAEGTTTSPLRRALAGADPEQVRDLSPQGIVEIRGSVQLLSDRPGEEVVRLSPRRAFVFTQGDPPAEAERLRAPGVLAYDMSAAYAGIAIRDERVLRRLTDLDLSQVPAAGPFANVTALFRRGDDGWLHVHVQQELGHYVAEAVLDAVAGLDRSE